MSTTEKCPKCGYTSNTGFADCPSCGVIISKFLEIEKEQNEYEQKESFKTILGFFCFYIVGCRGQPQMMM